MKDPRLELETHKLVWFRQTVLVSSFTRFPPSSQLFFLNPSPQIVEEGTMEVEAAATLLGSWRRAVEYGDGERCIHGSHSAQLRTATKVC